MLLNEYEFSGPSIITKEFLRAAIQSFHKGYC